MCKLAGEQITCRWSSELTTCSRNGGAGETKEEGGGTVECLSKHSWKRPNISDRLPSPPSSSLLYFEFPNIFFPTAEFPLGIRLLSFLYLFSCLCLPSFILISVFPPLLPSSPDALRFLPSLLSSCESYFTARLIVKEKNENARRCGTESGGTNGGGRAF